MQEEQILKAEQGKEGVPSRPPPKDIAEVDSSEWSLDSLEEIKGVNLRSLEGQENPAPQKQKPAIEVKFPEKPSVLANAPLH